MEEVKTIKVVANDGKEYEYEIVCAFELPETGKNYVVYTDGTTDESKKLNIYAAVYDPEDETVFDDIETDEEWQAVEKMIESLKAEAGSDNGN